MSIDAIMNLMDWEANIDPHYKKHYFRPPVMDSKEDGVYEEKWISLGNPYVGTKDDRLSRPDGHHQGQRRLRLYPDPGLRHHGGYQCETAGMLRFGQLSADEFFVGEKAATAGVKITNFYLRAFGYFEAFWPEPSEMPQVSMD